MSMTRREMLAYSGKFILLTSAAASAWKYVLEGKAEAAGSNGNGAHSTQSIGDARGRLLQAARQMAEKTGKRLGEIIAEASEGKLSLEGLRDLTDADVPRVSAAMSRISKGGDL